MSKMLNVNSLYIDNFESLSEIRKYDNMFL